MNSGLPPINFFVVNLTLSYEDSIILDPEKLFSVKLTLPYEDFVVLDLVKLFFVVKLTL